MVQQEKESFVLARFEYVVVIKNRLLDNIPVHDKK